MMPVSQRDPLQTVLAVGAESLVVSVPFLRRVLRWLAVLPEGVRNELLRREVVAVERERHAATAGSATGSA